MKDGERKSYIDYRLEKSEETFEAAKLLVENKQWNSAINRLYYASFYAVTALLFKNRIEDAKSHSGIKSQFFLHFVKTKKIDTYLGKLYGDLFDWRQKGDYGDFFDFVEQDVKPLVQYEEILIHTIKQEIEK